MITEVSLKVLPVAPAEATLRFVGISQADALQRLNQWGGQPLPPNASRWLEEALQACCMCACVVLLQPWKLHARKWVESAWNLRRQLSTG